MKKQKGYIHISAADCALVLVIIGVVGWAIIEGIIWITSHIHIAWQ